MKIERPQSAQQMPSDAKKVFKGIVFDTYQWEQETYDGKKKTFEKIKRPDTVVVFPVLNDGTILLTEQQQPGTQSYMAATGGRVDEGEDILEAAKRELLEETGYEAEEFILWDAQHPTSKIEWVVYTFIAKGLTKVSEQKLDGGEKVTLKPVTFDELIKIGSSQQFGEKETIVKFIEAKYDNKKRQELVELFKPISIS